MKSHWRVEKGIGSCGTLRITGVLAVAFVLFTAAPLFALLFERDETVIIESGRTVSEDIYLFGNEIVVDGIVSGNLAAAGRRITIRGTVKKTALLAAQEIIIAGIVEDGVKACAQQIAIEGKIGGDLLLAAKEIKIKKQSEVKGDFLFAGSDAILAGLFKKDVIGAAKTSQIAGSVSGKVKVWVKNLRIMPQARIEGDVIYTSDSEAVIEQGAKIGGEVTRKAPEFRDELRKILPFVRIASATAKVIGFVMALLVGLVLILAAPKWMDSAAGALRQRPGACAGWGAVILFASPAGIAIAAATVVGIPLALITLFLYIIGLYVSQIVVGLGIGKLIVGRGGMEMQKAGLFGAFALGLAIIRLLRFIPVVNYIIFFAVVLFGLGSLLLSKSLLKGSEA